MLPIIAEGCEAARGDGLREELDTSESLRKPSLMKQKFTDKQGQYLAFIHYYTKIQGQPPAEADMQRFFRVTPPSVHQMVLTLEKRGLISRIPRQPRTIRVLVPPEELPELD